ncbi:MASE1 domain-containing protein [Novosphingobium sp. JCM 18896]|nr:MASE1 domain-containing protein [Novosphingobium sp. JCM 18896]MCW1432171.1 MASE1 domain-containing protein [Novosphingobium sp. JCM 18896]
MGLIGLGVTYFAVAAITINFSLYHGGVALVWVATAVLVAHLVNRPRSYWPKAALVCAVLGAAATTMFGLGFKAAVPFALINVVEAVGAAALLRRLHPGQSRFESLREIAIFIGVAGVVMPAVCGLSAGMVIHWLMDGSFFWETGAISSPDTPWVP